MGSSAGCFLGFLDPLDERVILGRSGKHGGKLGKQWRRVPAEKAVGKRPPRALRKDKRMVGSQVVGVDVGRRIEEREGNLARRGARLEQPPERGVRLGQVAARDPHEQPPTIVAPAGPRVREVLDLEQPLGPLVPMGDGERGARKDTPGHDGVDPLCYPARRVGKGEPVAERSLGF